MADDREFEDWWSSGYGRKGGGDAAAAFKAVARAAWSAGRSSALDWTNGGASKNSYGASSGGRRSASQFDDGYGEDRPDSGSRYSDSNYRTTSQFDDTDSDDRPDASPRFR